jgi:hypothetical protein
VGFYSEIRNQGKLARNKTRIIAILDENQKWLKPY